MSDEGRQYMNFYKSSDLNCRCKQGIACTALPMKLPFLRKFNALAKEWGKPLLITSGARCKLWNTHEGGADHSQHVESNAVDLNFKDAAESLEFSSLAEKFGFGGIGLGRHLVHIDDRDGVARWNYF